MPFIPFNPAGVIASIMGARRRNKEEARRELEEFKVKPNRLNQPQTQAEAKEAAKQERLRILRIEDLVGKDAARCPKCGKYWSSYTKMDDARALFYCNPCGGSVQLKCYPLKTFRYWINLEKGDFHKFCFVIAENEGKAKQLALGYDDNARDGWEIIEIERI